MRGLIIGRFQPFHEGHRRLVERIAGDVEEVVVGIGSAGQSHTKRNPFTSGERVQMVQSVLDGFDAKTYLIPIADVERNAVWVKHIETLCPRFEVAYTNNPFVERLFEEDGYEVRGTPLHNREEFCGTEIRRRMLADEEWTHLVPEAVVDGIEEVDGVERLRRIESADDPDDE